jgi:membrane-associated phospholipid phosphatase
MIGLLRRTKAFTIPFFILVGLSSLLLIFNNKIEIELWINARNAPLFDIFFKYFTKLGDGVTAAIISLIFILLNIRKGVILLLSFLISGLIIQILKIHVFPDILRPIGMIEITPAIHLVEGVKLWEIQSFPSGHSGTAFAVLYCFAAFTNDRKIQGLAFFTAALLAYSRLYLFQHFLNDVVAGAVLGTFTSLAIILVFDHWNLMNRLNKSVFALIRKDSGTK